MYTRVLFDLLSASRLIAIGKVVLVVHQRGQYRVNKKVFARLSQAVWILVTQESGDLLEYGLSETGREVALRLKAHNDRFLQLSLWEAEKAAEEFIKQCFLQQG